MTDEEIQKIKQDAWREGYDRGVKATKRENDLAIKVGEAIIVALDERYQFKEDHYD